jgi:hypothetical protein
MTRDQLLILVGLAFVLLINALARLLRRRREREAPREIEREAPMIPPRAPRLPLPVVEPRRARADRHGAPLPLSVPPYAARRRARSSVGSLQEVRHGIVLMTILGPCRALEPPGPHA